MTKAERAHRKKVLAAALVLLALGNRNASILKRMVRAAALGVVASGGDAEKVALAIYLVTRAAAARMRSGARVRARVAWTKTTGLSAVDHDTAATDLAHAERAAQGMHKTFKRKLTQQRDDETSEKQAMLGALGDLDPSFERTATTETFEAANDETEQLGTAAAGAGYVVVETWEAALDVRTCTECENLDGQTVTRPERFPQLPPLHPRCRCIVSSMLIAAEDAA